MATRGGREIRKRITKIEKDALNSRAPEDLIADLADVSKLSAARRSLVKMGERAFGPLIASLGNEELREPVQDTLLRMRHVAPALASALAAKDPDLRSADSCTRARAAGLLAHFSDSSTIPALIRALKDDDREVRAAAVDALGQVSLWCKDSRAVQPLVKLLHENDDPHLRCRAAAALAQVGQGITNRGDFPGVVYEELRALCADPDPQVRDEAREQLEWLES